MYAPIFRDTVAAGRFFIVGNHRYRSQTLLTNFPAASDSHGPSSNFKQYVMRNFDTDIKSFAFDSDIPLDPSGTLTISCIIHYRNNDLLPIPILNNAHPVIKRLDGLSPPFRIVRQGVITPINSSEQIHNHINALAYISCRSHSTSTSNSNPQPTN